MNIRKPKTTQELRYSMDGYARAKRRGHNLPNEWDDKISVPQRSWKKHRNTKYKG